MGWAPSLYSYLKQTSISSMEGVFYLVMLPHKFESSFPSLHLYWGDICSMFNSLCRFLNACVKDKKLATSVTPNYPSNHPQAICVGSLMVDVSNSRYPLIRPREQKEVLNCDRVQNMRQTVPCSPGWQWLFRVLCKGLS